MILRKPYAFLIKHFKLIHLLLCIPLIYLVIRTGGIYSFLSDYVRANYYTNVTNIPGTYINYFMYLAIILVILLVLAVYFLMRQKKKDTKFYLFLMIYYILLFVLITFSYGVLASVESAEIEAQTVRMYRDIAFIAYVPQFFFIAIVALRGIGFDIKKFNFEEDVKELEITDIDSEEFELVFGKNSYKYKRTFRRFIREFRYYVLENKVTFSILATVCVIVIVTMLYMNFEVFHKTYKQTQRLTHNNLLVTVTDSVLTNMDQGGNIIDDGKYYLAVALKIKNNRDTRVAFDYENFKAEVSGRLLTATIDRSTYFPDLGLAYSRDVKINGNEENTYVLTYEIDEAFLNQKINLKVLESIDFEVGSMTPVYKTITLNYDKIFENKEIRTVPFQKILELSKTRIGMVQIELNDFLIQNSYEYTYGDRLKNKIASKSRNTLLILKRNFSMDTYSSYYKSRKGEKSFVNDFLKLRYKIGEEEKTVNINDVTPENLSDTWVFEVPQEVLQADKIDLLVIVRGEIFVMEIK